MKYVFGASARATITRVVVVVITGLALAALARLGFRWHTAVEQLPPPRKTDPTPVAVFGLGNKALPTVTRTRRTSAPSGEPTIDRSSHEVPVELEAMLRRCVATIDVACYAPIVHTFQGQRRIPGTKVVEQRRRLLQLYPRIERYSVTNLRLESLTGRRAVVSFDKEWDMVGEKRYAGRARERLVAAKTRAGWRIVMQDEQQVYWTKRS